MPVRELSTFSKARSLSIISKPEEKFIGQLQPVKSRVPKRPEVDYERGGSDFRTPFNTSSFGKQVTKEGSKKIVFARSARFHGTVTLGVGPNYTGIGSMSKQIQSHKKTSGAMVFGTSTRDGSKKLYC
jgi:hypothetical protein